MHISCCCFLSKPACVVVGSFVFRCLPCILKPFVWHPSPTQPNFNHHPIHYPPTNPPISNGSAVFSTLRNTDVFSKIYQSIIWRFLHAPFQYIPILFSQSFAPGTQKEPRRARADNSIAVLAHPNENEGQLRDIFSRPRHASG